MSNEARRDRGNLFENTDKKKPSQPDFQGDCTIDSVAYEIRGYRRNDQLTLNLAPPRGDRNTYPPDVFKGALEAAPPAKKSGRGGKDANAAPTPAWTGEIESEDARYAIKGFEKQGKSGLYYTLSFERLEKKAREPDEWVDAADAAELGD
jgi:hypothetical protein